MGLNPISQDGDNLTLSDFNFEGKDFTRKKWLVVIYRNNSSPASVSPSWGGAVELNGTDKIVLSNLSMSGTYTAYAGIAIRASAPTSSDFGDLYSFPGFNALPIQWVSGEGTATYGLSVNVKAIRRLATIVKVTLTIKNTSSVSVVVRIDWVRLRYESADYNTTMDSVESALEKNYNNTSTLADFTLAAGSEVTKSCNFNIPNTNVTCRVHSSVSIKDKPIYNYRHKTSIITIQEPELTGPES